MNKPEILAPAGNIDALKVAINNGADAVYLGLQDFNARISADNFTTQNIAEYVRYAHTYGVKVYLTVNTLVNNTEMPLLINTVKSAVEAKVDAYLVQDLGVFSVLKKCFPNINLHASTQLGVHNLYGALQAQKLGFTRIVLSREAKLEDIIQIRKNTNLEIEYFVQGALCIAFSGNCYFSGMMQDNSGNRGRCKQYCRMKYTPNLNENEYNEKYMLSARDLCLINNLSKLIEAGVTSFKIEGRLRRSGYVAQAVHSYRQAIDHILYKTEYNNKIEIYNLKKVFSRGEFNYDAYLNSGVPDDVVNPNVQNHLGIEIGKVIKVVPFKDLLKVTISSSHQLNTGDGLKFLDKGTQICSLGVGNVEKIDNNTFNIYTKHKIKKDYAVYLILDSVAEQKLIDVNKKIKINATINALANNNLSCTLTCGNVSVDFCSDFVLQPAQNCPTQKEEIAMQFAKLGDTYFEVENCTVTTNNVFIPKSVLNNFRRNAILKLEEHIVLHNQQNITATIDNKAIEEVLSFKAKQTQQNKFSNIFVINEDNLSFAKNKLSKDCIVVLSPQQYNKNVVQKFLDEFKGFKVGLNLPIIANHKDLIMLDDIINQNKDLVLVSNNIYGLHYANTHQVIAGLGMNVFNNYTIQFLKDLGVSAYLLSIEQQLSNITMLKNLYVYSLGYVPLMTFAHCPYKTIYKNTCKTCKFTKGLSYTDVSGNKFCIVRHQLSQCYFELLNSKLINNLGSVDAQKYIDLRYLTETQVDKVLESVLTNKKVKISSQEILGKIFKAVD